MHGPLPQKLVESRDGLVGIEQELTTKPCALARLDAVIGPAKTSQVAVMEYDGYSVARQANVALRAGREGCGASESREAVFRNAGSVQSPMCKAEPSRLQRISL